MTAYTLRLPWAHRILHANQRLHWAEKARRVRTVRSTVAAYANLGKLPKNVAHATVTLTWHPPKAYRTDALNLAPLLKAATDGLVDFGLIADDTPRFVTEHCRIGEPAMPGHFLLHIEVDE